MLFNLLRLSARLPRDALQQRHPYHLLQVGSSMMPSEFETLVSSPTLIMVRKWNELQLLIAEA